MAARARVPPFDPRCSEGRTTQQSQDGYVWEQSETRSLIELISELAPEAVVALHAPLGCIDDPNASPLGLWLADRTALPLVADPGYPTPGSFGTWAAEQGLPAVTYEFGLVAPV